MLYILLNDGVEKDRQGAVHERPVLRRFDSHPAAVFQFQLGSGGVFQRIQKRFILQYGLEKTLAFICRIGGSTLNKIIHFRQGLSFTGLVNRAPSKIGLHFSYPYYTQPAALMVTFPQPNSIQGGIPSAVAVKPWAKI